MNFLVRTKDNRITGPFSKEIVVERVRAGKLNEMDEVCPATGYWIFLHEREESMKMLGVSLPRSEDFHDESTETDTETATATAPLDVSRKAPQSPKNSDPPLDPASTYQPERVRVWLIVLWVIAIVIGFILFRVYEVARAL